VEEDDHEGEREEAVGAGLHTVFVNASNMPAGPNALRNNGEKVSMGGRGFQPVVVDLLE